jgi:iron(III) transport system substrate-binding protein
MRMAWVVMVAAVVMAAGCGGNGSSTNEVVVYTSVDEQVARPILEEFQKRTGITVRIQTDKEVTKTAGLVERLIAEKANPQADVYWGNEVFYTIRLANEGGLAEYDSPAAAEIPGLYKDAKKRWAGTALRARVIARTTADEGRSASAGVSSLADLARPELKGRICMASPAAGTTGGHVAAMYTIWGRERFEEYLLKLKANEIALLGGNAIVAQKVGDGTMWAGLTDNDDVEAVLREKGKLQMVLPDQHAEGIGTLAIPCTVGLVAGAKHAEAGRKMVDYLLSREVEKKLLDAKFARYSVFAPAGEGGVKAMAVDYAQVAGNLTAAKELALKVLQGR